MKEEKQTLINRLASRNLESDKEETKREGLKKITDELTAINQNICFLMENQKKAATSHDITLLRSEIRTQKDKNVNPEQTLIYEDREKLSSTVESVDCQKTREKHPNSQLDTSKYSVFILGDSVTKVLRTDKMSTDKTNVKIKSQGGANLKVIHSKMSSLIANQPHVQNTDVFVIHAGINNILHGDQPEEVKQQLLELTELLRQINPHIKIIFPMKADKTYQEKITNTNELLRTLCNEKRITFIDNTDSFMEISKQTNQSLYVNEVHLNNHGAAVFAKQIKATIRQLLKIERRKTQGNFRQAGR
jgi:lysophospholipase L1-like esterase